MSFDWSFRDYFNLSKKIPLHYQKRYLANYSNGSFNSSMLAGIYKNKIKKLQENNNTLALALQNVRIQKEELLAENRTNADLVLFSRCRLAAMSEFLKKAASLLDEATFLLEKHSTTSVSKFTPKNTVCREEFKEQLKESPMAVIPEEIETPEDIPAKRQLTDVTLEKTKDVIQSSCAKRKPSKQNSKIEQKNRENKFTNENSKQIKIWDEMVSPVKKCVNLQVDESEISTHNKFFSLKVKKKNISSRKRTQKAKSQATENSKEDNIIETETMQIDKLKEKKLSSEINSKESNYLIKSTKKTVQLNCDTSVQEHIDEGIHQEQEKQENLKEENSSKPLKRNKKETFELHETVDNLNIEESPLSDSLKNSAEKLLLDTEKENSLNKDVKKQSTKKTALRNISSKINIENMKLEKMKQKSVFPLDDFTLTQMDAKEIKKIKSICPLSFSLDDWNIEESPLSDSLKNSTEKLLLDTEKESSLNKDVKKQSTKETALKNISSKINIENMKLEKMKRKSVFPLHDLTLTQMDAKKIKKKKSICPLSLDDLTCSEISDRDIVQKRKSNKLFLKNNKKPISRKKILKENVSSTSDTDKPSTGSAFQSDVTLCKKEEMVKSLAENTFLVTAEVHKTPPNILEICPKISNLQPVVLLNDVFKASKSLCKNISSLPFDQTSENALEKQLLQRCSSLKIIAENSLNTQNQRSLNTDSGVGKSVDQSENSSKTILQMEPLLLEEGEVNEEQMTEDKKTLRRKASSVCYREPPLNIKMRREKFGYMK